MKSTLMQLCALDSLRNWTVSTGAGAGKTLCLTLRFIKLLEHDPELKIGKILALTFTQKAAAEMRAKIYQEINNILEDPNSSAGMLNRFSEIKEEFAKAAISTFHAFCSSLLREHPVESRVDSDFSVASEFVREQALRTAYDEVLHSYIWRDPKGDSQEKNQRFLTLLECWDHRRIRQITFDLLSNPERYESFTHTFSKAIENQDAFIDQILKRGADRVFQEIKKDSFFDNLVSLQNHLQTNPLESNEMSDFIEQLTGILISLSHSEDLFRHLPKLNTLLEHPAIRSGARAGRGFLTAKQIGKHLTDSGLVNLDRDLEQKSLEYLALLIIFINEVHLHYLDLCRSQNMLDFHQLQQKVHELLTQHVNVLERERARYQYLLVDEFQDTDALQWKILKLLASESSGRLQQRKIFIVGDEKQSIYAFRGGEVRIFHEASNEICNTNETSKPLYFEGSNDPLLKEYAHEFAQFARENPQDANRIRSGRLAFNENFRSHRIPTEFFNEFFEKLFQPENGLDPAPQKMLCTKGEHDSPGSVQILMIPSLSKRREEIDESENEEGVLDLHLSEAKSIVKHIQGALQDGGKGAVAKALLEKKPAVAVLFRRFTKVKSYEEVFRQEKVDFFVHRGKGFFRRQEILDLYNILEFLHDSRKDIHLVGLLRAPVFGLTDAEIFQLCKGRDYKSIYHLLQENRSPRTSKMVSWLRTWKELKDRLRLSELLRLIISQTSWNAIFALGLRGRQTLYNVEKFIEIARQFEDKGKRGLAEFCAFIREKIDHDEQEGEALLGESLSSPVVFMTIHQAKGLQFPMVVIPDLNGTFRFPKGDLLEVLQEPDGYFFGIHCPNPHKGFVKQPTAVAQLLQERARLRLEAEEKRLFYVGCTRAIEHLLLVGEARVERAEPTKTAKSVWDWLEKILKIEQGVNQIQLGAATYPVSWYQATEPLQKEIPAVMLPMQAMQKDGSVDLYLHAIEPKGPVRISPTALVTFRECRRKFYYRELLSIPENLLHLFAEKVFGDEIPDPQDVNSEKRLYAGLSGSIVHQLLENIESLHEDLLPERVRILLENEWVRIHGEGKLDESLDREILMHVRAFTNDADYLGLFQKLKHANPPRIFSEVPFEVRQGDVLLRGQIDKIFQREENGPWSILDFKTDRLKGSGEAARKEAQKLIHERHYDLQINCYALACEEILGKGKVQELTLYFTDQEVGAIEIPRDDLQVMDSIMEIEKTIKERDIFSLEEAKPLYHALCRSCGYGRSRICDYSG